MTLIQAINLILSTLGIFTCIIVITRVVGLRTFAKMSSFDFASTIAVGSVLAAIILNSDYSIVKGAIVLAAIIAYQYAFAYLVRNVPFIKNLATNTPQIIMWNGIILDDKLKQCNVGKDELIAKLREANVHHFSEVKAVVFESTGDISVLHNDTNKAISPELLHNINTTTLHDHNIQKQ